MPYILKEKELVSMIRVLLQTFVEEDGVGRSVYPNCPRTEKELIELQVPSGYECILVHRVSRDTINICLIKKEFPEEGIVL